MATRREKVDIVTDFLFLGSKITADGDCSHEIRRRLLLGRKAMTNPDNVMKSRDITLPTKATSQSYVVFPGEGNVNPLQYSCLENPMDRGAWLAAVHGVAKSWTRLKRLSSSSSSSSTGPCHLKNGFWIQGVASQALLPAVL